MAKKKMIILCVIVFGLIALFLSLSFCSGQSQPHDQVDLQVDTNARDVPNESADTSVTGAGGAQNTEATNEEVVKIRKAIGADSVIAKSDAPNDSETSDSAAKQAILAAFDEMKAVPMTQSTNEQLEHVMTYTFGGDPTGVAHSLQNWLWEHPDAELQDVVVYNNTDENDGNRKISFFVYSPETDATIACDGWYAGTLKNLKLSHSNING